MVAADPPPYRSPAAHWTGSRCSHSCSRLSISWLALQVSLSPMAQCSSDTAAKVPPSGSGTSPGGMASQQQQSVDQSMKPVLFEIFGELWNVEQRLGQGVSASVYQVSSGRATTAAVKEFQADGQGGDYGYQKERSVLEDIQGRKNIGRSN